jgi:tripartite-type tricarboxylate transporter receptor subunit TctC
MLITLICSICQFSANGWAQVYPAKPVRLVVPGQSGSGELLGRLIAAGLTESFGQQVFVDARPGANGIIAADNVAKAPPDGYTLFLVNIAQAANVSLYGKLAFDLVRDFSAVTQLTSSPHVAAVHPSLPVKSISELVKLAKANPGAINYSFAGTGSSTFLAAELFKRHAGVNVVHVPYKGGGAALTSIMAGETSVHFPPVASSLPYIRQGRMRALAMTSAKRLPFLSELPTIAESGYPGYEFVNWYGLLAPARTPKETITTIRVAAVTVLNRPDVSKRLIDLSYIAIGDQPEEFAAYVRSEVEKLAKLVRDLQLTAHAAD